MPADAPPLRYRLSPLDAEGEPIFPRADSGGKEDYARLYAEFCEALKPIPLRLGVRHYLHSLATVLERFTWCIPSSTYGTRADISLYDHAATTAAIAQALLACPAGKERFLLFGADLGGIQKFIFGEAGHADGGDRGAGKLLRARSFLLQALSRSVWLVLLERLELSQAARIMDAGGRFVLLLPDTEAVRGALDRLETEVARWLLDAFQGSVRMTFARLPLEPDDLRRERFVTCFERFNDALEAAKLHPWQALFAEHVSPVLPWITRPTGNTGNVSSAACVRLLRRRRKTRKRCVRSAVILSSRWGGVCRGPATWCWSGVPGACPCSTD